MRYFRESSNAARLFAFGLRPFYCDTTDSPRGRVGFKVVLPVDQGRGARSMSGVTSICLDFGSLHQKPRVRGTYGCVSDGRPSPGATRTS